MKKIAIIIFALAAINIMPAQKIGIFIESGTTINQPLKKQAGTPINWSSQQTIGYYSKAYTTCGYYFKAGVDVGIVSKKNWSFGIPAGFSYMQVNRKDYTETMADPAKIDLPIQGYGGTFYRYNYNRTNSIAAFFGPQFKISCNRMSFYSNILLNGMKAITDHEYTMNSVNGKKSLSYIHSVTNPFRNSFVTSYGLGMQYKMKACTLGINSDLYFMRPFAKGAYNSPMPFLGNRIWINPGIRFQYNFK